MVIKLHGYSVDIDYNTKIIYYIALLSVVISIIVNLVINLLSLMYSLSCNFFVVFLKFYRLYLLYS